MRKLQKHLNIVKINGIFSEKHGIEEFLYVEMPFYSNSFSTWISGENLIDNVDKTVKEITSTKRKFTDILKLFKQLILTLNFIHSHKIIHRYIKFSNVLISNEDEEEEKIILTDFGIGKELTKIVNEEDFEKDFFFMLENSLYAPLTD